MKKNDITDNKKIRFLFILLILSFSCFLLIFMKSESDYLWHVKTGEYMVKNNILKTDVFSWSVIGRSWISHEWLFEVLIYFLKTLFPKAHLLIYGYTCIVTLLLILFLANKKDYVKNILFGLLWLSFSILFMSHMQGRPNLISFNLFALTIMLLYNNYLNKDSKLIYFLPFISLLWSNFHGGSSNLVYIFSLIFYICSFIRFNSSKIISNKCSKIQRRRFFIVTLLCMLTTNINIHGFKMFIYPYQNMLDTTMLNVIQEWQPINLNVINHYPYLLLILVILFVLLFSKKKIVFIDLLLFLISIFLGFKSIRFCCYTYIIMSFVIFKYINPRKEDKGTKIVISFLCVGFFSIFLLNYKNIKYNVNHLDLSPSTIDIIRREKPKKLFNSYNLGGELIYNNIAVFIDGRADLYSPDILSDYLKIVNTSSNYKTLINKYDFDYYLIDINSNIYYMLNSNEEYSLVVKDNNYLLYKKN